jgi:hypothetical protein
MDDRPHHFESEDADVEAGRGTASGTRRRMSMLGGILAIAIAIALVVVFVLLHLTGTLGPEGH